jgi:hypothetical protein
VFYRGGIINDSTSDGIGGQSDQLGELKSAVLEATPNAVATSKIGASTCRGFRKKMHQCHGKLARHRVRIKVRFGCDHLFVQLLIDAVF